MPTNEEINNALAALFGGPATTRRYPTKEEIMAEPWPTHKTSLLRAVKTWKKQVWQESRGTIEERNRALETLVSAMADVYDRPCSFRVEENVPSPFYSRGVITMNQSASVISTMHEFAHHLFGPDETKACRWSVHLFRKTFPKAYDRLVWRGHCLVKPE